LSLWSENLVSRSAFRFSLCRYTVRKMFIGIDKDKTGKCDPGYNRVGTNPGLCEPCAAGAFSAVGLYQLNAVYP
jgi:hypothetical protein